MSNMSIAVCILFYERLAQTIECIESFLPSGVPIYVLNNGSSRPARKGLQELCTLHRQVTIIDSGTNLGVAVGRNRLIAKSAEEWLFFVDNDITIRTPDWAERMRQHVESNPAVEVFIPRAYNVHEKCYMTSPAFALTGNEVEFKNITGEETNCFPGGASCICRKLFKRLGVYDEQMFVGVQDYELAIRGIMQGEPVRARVIGDIELYHDHRPVDEESDRKAVLTRYNVDVIEMSFERIREKHQVVLRGRWKLWAIMESRRMIPTKNVLGRIINKGIIYFYQKVSLLYLKLR